MEVTVASDQPALRRYQPPIW